MTVKQRGFVEGLLRTKTHKSKLVNERSPSAKQINKGFWL